MFRGERSARFGKGTKEAQERAIAFGYADRLSGVEKDATREINNDDDEKPTRQEKQRQRNTRLGLRKEEEDKPSYNPRPGGGGRRFGSAGRNMISPEREKKRDRNMSGVASGTEPPTPFKQPNLGEEEKGKGEEEDPMIDLKEMHRLYPKHSAVADWDKYGSRPDPITGSGEWITNEEEGKEILLVGGAKRQLCKGEKVQHYNDVHGIQLGEIKQLDDRVRKMRYRTDDNTSNRLGHLVLTYMRQNTLSPHAMAQQLYKDQFKSTWLLPRKGNLTYRLHIGDEKSFLAAAMTIDLPGTWEDVTEALSKDNLPPPDGSRERQNDQLDLSQGYGEGESATATARPVTNGIKFNDIE